MSKDPRHGAARGSHDLLESELATSSSVTDDTENDVSGSRPKISPRRQRAASCDSMSGDENIKSPNDSDTDAYSSTSPSLVETESKVDFVKKRLLEADEYFQELNDLGSKVFHQSRFQSYMNGKVGAPFDGTIRFKTMFIENASFQTFSHDYILGFCGEVANKANKEAANMDLSTTLAEWSISPTGEHYINYRMHHRTIEHLIHLIECRNIISAAWENVVELKSAAYCGEFISLLVLDHTRRDVARLVRIECKRIEKLTLAFEECLFQVLSSDPAQVLFDTISAIGNDVTVACQQILTDLDIKIASTADLKDVWQCAVHVLNVAVVSYSGAHTQIFGSDKIKSIPLPGYFLETQYFRFRRRSFSCLSEFLGGHEAWVLEKIHHGMDPVDPTHLSLLTDAETFGDIWGPMWKSCILGNEEQIIQYNVGNGVILAWKQPSSTAPEIRKGEVFCHWMSDKNHRDYKGFTNSPPLYENDTLLIGATVRLATNSQCKLSTTQQKEILRNSKALSEPGTIRNGRMLSSEIVRIQIGGRCGNFGLQREYKRRGRTLKQCLIEDWKLRPLKRHLGYLEFNLGLEVSACTKNARRIRLIKLFGTQTMLNHLWHGSLPWKSKNCEEQFYSALQDPDHTAFRKLYNSNPDWQTDLGNAVEYCLATLEDTGKNEKDLELFWSPDDEPGLKVFLKSNEFSWINFLAETETSGTLAILEDRCLELRSSTIGNKCQNSNSKARNTNRKLLNSDQSILETSAQLNHLCVPDSIRHELTKNVRRDSQSSRNEYRWSVSQLRKGDRLEFGTKGFLEIIEPLDQARILAKWGKIPDLLRLIKSIVPSGRKSSMEHYECIRKGNRHISPVHFFIISTTPKEPVAEPWTNEYNVDFSKDGQPRSGVTMSFLQRDRTRYWRTILYNFAEQVARSTTKSDANV